MAAGPATGKPAVLTEIESALARQDRARASALARQALAAGLEHPFLLNLRAQWHESERQFAEAIADLKRALLLAPNSAPVHTSLGMAYVKGRRYTEAIASFDEAIRCDPAFGPAHFNKAKAAEDLGDLPTARDCYARAHECSPGHPDPLANLASLATRYGERQDARALAMRALTIHPGHGLANIVMAATETGNDAEVRLRTLLARGDLSAIDRGVAGGMLGDILDREGRYAEAFAAYRAGNDAVRRLFAAEFEGPGVETTPMFLGWNISQFGEIDLADWASDEAEIDDGGATGHVFVLGFPRSGTTLLEQALGSHPGVVTSGERDLLIDGTEAFLGTPTGMHNLAMARGTALSAYRRAYWERAREYGLHVAKKMFIDKQPYNTLKLPLIAKLFPNAKIVFCVRDPRDVVLSCFRRRFQMSPPNFELLTLDGAAQFYDLTMRLAERYRASLPLQFFESRHEDLVDDFDTQLRGICGFIGLPWDDRLRAFAERAATQAIATPSAQQLREGLNRRGVGHWRHYAEHLAPLMPTLQPWIERFGYPPN